MKKTIILFILIAFTSFSGWTQKIAYNGTPVFTGAEGTSILIPYKYTSTVTCKIEVSISRYNGVGGFDYVSFVGSAITTNKAAGTDLTGTLTFNIPNGTLPTNLLDPLHLYRIQMELKNNSTNAWITGVYGDVFTVTGDGINYAPPVITTAETGTIATINYKYNSSTPASIYSKIERQYGWTAQTPTIADKFVPSLAAGSGLTGSYTLAIPAGATPSEFLNSDLVENYKLILELTNSTGYQGGLYTPFEITQGTAIQPAISVTSIPASVQAGTNLVFNYKYTAVSGGKASVVVTKNGGTNAYDYISTVGFVELNPAAAGTDITGTFTVPIPASTTPTNLLTGNENYRVTLELKDAAGNFLAGDYSKINYTITAGTVPYINVTSIPTSTQAGTNLVVNYKYTAAVAGKVSVVVTKNGGVNAYDYISTVGFVELNPASAGTNLMGTFTVPIPANITPTASLTGNENYRVTLELKNANDVFVAGDYSTINYNITASLGVNDFDYNKLSVFPNPVNTVLKIANTSDLSNPSFRILNISGQTVQKSKILNDEGINVSGLKTGIYMLSVDSDKKSKQIKFIKK